MPPNIPTNIYPTVPGQEGAPGATPVPAGVVHPPALENPDKSYIVAMVLAWFVGIFGVDRFYLGYIGLGIAKLAAMPAFMIFTIAAGGGLLFFWLAAMAWVFWSLVDLLLIATDRLRHCDNPEQPLTGYGQYGGTLKIIAFITAGLSALSLIGSSLLFLSLMFMAF